SVALLALVPLLMSEELTHRAADYFGAVRLYSPASAAPLGLGHTIDGGEAGLVNRDRNSLHNRMLIAQTPRPAPWSSRETARPLTVAARRSSATLLTWPRRSTSRASRSSCWRACTTGRSRHSPATATRPSSTSRT